MYADNKTASMTYALQETERRRMIQEAHNTKYHITPVGISKSVRDLTDRIRKVAEQREVYAPDADKSDFPVGRDELTKLIKDLEKQMKQSAKDLEFEKAAALRDQIVELRKTLALTEQLEIA